MFEWDTKVCFTIPYHTIPFTSRYVCEFQYILQTRDIFDINFILYCWTCLRFQWYFIITSAVLHCLMQLWGQRVLNVSVWYWNKKLPTLTARITSICQRCMWQWVLVSKTLLHCCLSTVPELISWRIWILLLCLLLHSRVRLNVWSFCLTVWQNQV